MGDEWDEQSTGFGGNGGDFNEGFSSKLKVSDDNEGGNKSGGFRRRNGDDNGGYKKREYHDRNGDDNGGYKKREYKDRNGDDDDQGFKKSNYRKRNEDGEDQPRYRKKDDGENAEGEEKPEKKEFYIPPETNEEDLFDSNITSGINFGNYDHIPVKVTGEDPPPAIATFDQCVLSDAIMENVTRSNYKVPTPIQKNGMPVIAAGRDLMACAQTGSGKTAAFLLPILSSLLKNNTPVSVGKPHAVIVSPTRELAIQIYDEAKKFAHRSYLKIVITYGGTASRHQSDNLSKGPHLIVATPGRLLDFVDKGYIAFDEVKFIVLDEADRMLDLGFMPSIEKMMNHPTMAKAENRQTLMFSATFPEEIQRAAGAFLKNYIFVAVGIVGSACSDVEQQFYKVSKFEKRQKLIDLLEEIQNPKGTLVFVETKRNADFLASLLSETKFSTTSIHGDRMQREREEALRDFKSGKMLVLIATSVAARGLDIKNVTHVVNYDLPTSIDEYVHRIGRTGRVGNKGKATSFYDEENNAAIAGDLVKILEQAGQAVPSFLSGAGASGSGGGSSGFGGRDVRREAPSMPTANEEEEEW